MSVNDPSNVRRVYRIVYVGPEGAGKTTTLLAIHRLSREPVRGPLRYLSSQLIPKSTLDLLTLELGTINGLRTTARLYTAPGNKECHRFLSRIVRGATSIVFVTDSQIAKVGSNLDFVYEFRTNIISRASTDGLAPPIIYQFNKSDLPSTVEPDRMAEILGIGDEAYFTTAALNGSNVFVPLKTAIERSIWFLEARRGTKVTVHS